MNGLMLPNPNKKTMVLKGVRHDNSSNRHDNTENTQDQTYDNNGTRQSGVVNALTVSSNIYALNVFLNTFLFILVFVSGTLWSTTCLEYLKKRPTARGMLGFSFMLTLITCCLAIGVGELSRLNSKIQVDYQSDLG